MASSCKMDSCHCFPQNLLYLSQRLDQICYQIEAGSLTEQAAKEKSAAFKAFGKLLSYFQLETATPAMAGSFVHLNDKFYRVGQRIPPSSQPLQMTLPHNCEKAEDYLSLLLLTNCLEEIEWSLEDQLRDHPVSEAFVNQIKLDTFGCHIDYLWTTHKKMQIWQPSQQRDEDFFNANFHFLEKYDRIKTKILLVDETEPRALQERAVALGTHLSEPILAKIKKIQAVWLEMDQNFKMKGQTKNAVKNEHLHHLAKEVVQDGFQVSPLGMDTPYYAVASAYIAEYPCLKPAFLQLMNYL
jgi:hypothetical protein